MSINVHNFRAAPAWHVDFSVASILNLIFDLKHKVLNVLLHILDNLYQVYGFYHLCVLIDVDTSQLVMLSLAFRVMTFP